MLHHSNGTWTLTLPNSDVETYNTGGQLTSITTREGFTTTLTYSSTGILITDGFGRTLTIALDGTGRITTVTDPAGGVTTYGFTGSAEVGDEALTSITYPDTRIRQYTYSEIGGRQHLTSIIDENGHTYASYAYNSSGRIVSTQHAGGADAHTFSYTTNFQTTRHPSATIVDPLGKSRDYTFDQVGAGWRLASLTGGPSPEVRGHRVHSVRCER